MFFFFFINYFSIYMMKQWCSSVCKLRSLLLLMLQTLDEKEKYNQRCYVYIISPRLSAYFSFFLFCSILPLRNMHSRRNLYEINRDSSQLMQKKLKFRQIDELIVRNFIINHPCQVSLLSIGA